MKKTINFMLAGVGGQGTILASDVLADVGLAAGYQAKQAEVHGMSQRGGSVTSYVRWGEMVYSPLVGAGEVDVFLTFEKVEALRNLDQLRPGALAVVSLEAIKPVTVTSGGQLYPDDAHLRLCLSQVTPQAFYVDVQAIANRAGQPQGFECSPDWRPFRSDGKPGHQRTRADCRNLAGGDLGARAEEDHRAE